MLWIDTGRHPAQVIDLQTRGNRTVCPLVVVTMRVPARATAISNQPIAASGASKDPDPAVARVAGPDLDVPHMSAPMVSPHKRGCRWSHASPRGGEGMGRRSAQTSGPERSSALDETEGAQASLRSRADGRLRRSASEARPTGFEPVTFGSVGGGPSGPVFPCPHQDFPAQRLIPEGNERTREATRGHELFPPRSHRCSHRSPVGPAPLLPGEKGLS